MPLCLNLQRALIKYLLFVPYFLQLTSFLDSIEYNLKILVLFVRQKLLIKGFSEILDWLTLESTNHEPPKL
jgi:hypothetical protein